MEILTIATKSQCIAKDKNFVVHVDDYFQPKMMIVFRLLHKSICYAVHWNRLTEMIPMSTITIVFAKK